MHDDRCTRPTYTVNREELSFRSGALKSRSRDLTTKPPQPVSVLINLVRYSGYCVCFPRLGTRVRSAAERNLKFCHNLQSNRTIYLSTRSGAFVVTPAGPYGLLYDYIFLRLCFYYLVKVIPIHFVSWLLESLYLKPQLNKNTYKIKPSQDLLSKDPVLNDHINEKLSSEQVTQKPDIKCFTKDGIIFEGDTEVTEVDIVIMATWYTYKFPFLEDDIVTQEEGIINLYKCMFPIHLQHSTLAVIGFVMPFGPGFPILELQCRYAVQILAGKCKLPSYELMLKDVKEKYGSNLSRFTPSEKMSLRVDYIEYSNELASKFGAKPNLLKLLITDTGLFLRVLFGPSLPYQYRLQGPHCWDGARKAIIESRERMSWTIQDLNASKNIFQKFIKKILGFFFL
ncbi:Dimethylaniline monooxygenase [N-oxide-forming] 2 [Araneus ventricosus]|uniref:Flavin-containing monooxygenase n=1 Tax=Araneus ventricosus TaxID=182803 RepID=A0A4Y2KTC8_ARAVE|nr:Dimethylaniline monooxygenase [N-oxide-forming] 2 [Araneus ventricosus]